jgi:hypothetical protein
MSDNKTIYYCEKCKTVSMIANIHKLTCSLNRSETFKDIHEFTEYWKTKELNLQQEIAVHKSMRTQAEKLLKCYIRKVRKMLKASVLDIEDYLKRVS